MSFYGPLTVMGYSYFRIYRAATAYRSEEAIISIIEVVFIMQKLVSLISFSMSKAEF